MLLHIFMHVNFDSVIVLNRFIFAGLVIPRYQGSVRFAEYFVLDLSDKKLKATPYSFMQKVNGGSDEHRRQVADAVTKYLAECSRLGTLKR
jgi:hypothetical protein